jgi:hypothetical protein
MGLDTRKHEVELVLERLVPASYTVLDPSPIGILTASGRAVNLV